MRDARAPSSELALLCAFVAGAGGLLLAILVFVAETWAVRAGLGMGAAAAFVLAGGLYGATAWSGPAFSAAAFAGAAFLSGFGVEWQVLAAIAAVLGVATSWNFVRITWVMRRDGLTQAPSVAPPPPEPTRFVSSRYVTLWIVVAVVGVVLALVLPWFFGR